jgi:ATP-dependent RNA helicase RhlE
MSFDSLGLTAELTSAVRNKGYTAPTPIQQKAIPSILLGKDVMGGARTGTGKTAAFALPILQMLNERPRTGRAPRALVLTPTRELAAQVSDSFSTYGRNLRLKSTSVFGGVGITPQIDRLKRGVDILVACPGRLLDHASQGTVDLSRVEILVLDEADRMLDMGFIHDIRRVLKLLPRDRQNLLFSATYSDEVKKLADALLRAPMLIEVSTRNAPAENVDHLVHFSSQKQKAALLSHLIREGKWNRVLVFTRTKHGANRLSTSLERDGISSMAIHGNKSQSARTEALRRFKEGAVRILVATDVAARGLDIDSLPRVVNFELPHVPEDYIHRIGRTARAGASGKALSLVCRDEQPMLCAIERLLKHPIAVESVRGFEPPLDEASSPPPAPRTDSGRRPRNAGNNHGRLCRSNRNPGARLQARA